MTADTCGVEGCGGDRFSRQWCAKHYQRWRRHGDVHHTSRPHSYGGATCSVGDCTKKVLARGWCHAHYERWRRDGDVREDEPLRPYGDREAQLWSKVDVRGEDDCWLWTAGVTGTMGYGRVVTRGQEAEGVYAHRLAYELLVGPIPDGLEIDHLCRVPRCVNPRHLEPVPHRVNVLRGESFAAHNHRATHCVGGHALAGDNLISRPDGTRACRECQRASDRRRRQRERAERANAA